jgi:NADP-dependent 3-hydroxy acid dehydrogenase YdfG
MVNISSIAGQEAYEGGSVYCASKAYVKMISKSLRLDLAGTGVRITDIAPGAVETEFSEVRFKGNTTMAKAVYQGFMPLQAADVAEAIAFALDRPAHVNIETMLIMPTAQAGATRIARK